MKTIPESHQDLLKDETKAFVYLATLMKDGTPQVTPVWFNMDGDYILLNSATGRLKDKNMRARPNVALCISRSQESIPLSTNPRQNRQISTEGAEDHIETLNLKYHGNRNYPGHNPEHPRVIYKIEPLKAQTMG